MFHILVRSQTEFSDKWIFRKLSSFSGLRAIHKSLKSKISNKKTNEQPRVFWPVIFQKQLFAGVLQNICSAKYILQSLRESICAGISFLIKLLTQGLSCHFCKIFKNIFFYRTSSGDYFQSLQKFTDVTNLEVSSFLVQDWRPELIEFFL